MNKKLLTTFCLALLFLGCKEVKKNSTEKESSLHQDTEKPIYVSSEKGKEWDIFGVKIIGKILSDETNGEYSVIVTETPPNGGPPKHIHSQEDELFYVLKGQFTFTCGEETIQAKEGDFVRLPRGVPHQFVNTDSTTGITMNTITPGGFDHFFMDVAELTQKGEMSRIKVDSLGKVYGVQFLKQ